MRFSVDRRLIGKDKHGIKLSWIRRLSTKILQTAILHFSFLGVTFLNIIFQASLAMIWVSFEFEWGMRGYSRYLYCKCVFAAGACQVLESAGK